MLPNNTDGRAVGDKLASLRVVNISFEGASPLSTRNGTTAISSPNTKSNDDRRDRRSLSWSSVAGDTNIRA